MNKRSLAKSGLVCASLAAYGATVYLTIRFAPYCPSSPIGPLGVSGVNVVSQGGLCGDLHGLSIGNILLFAGVALFVGVIFGSLLLRYVHAMPRIRDSRSSAFGSRSG